MSTLTSRPVVTLLQTLFSEAAAADAPLRTRLQSMTPEARAELMNGAKTDYRGFYHLAKDMFLPVSRETGKLLYLLARARGARNIVEFGTSFGLSTIHLAAALKDNGGGRLIGTELEPAKAERARRNLAAAELSDGVEIREGDALQSLARDLPQSIDLVLLDGAKVLYPRILALLEPRLAASALLLADNADDSPEYVAHVREPRSGYISLPFGGDVELSMRCETA